MVVAQDKQAGTDAEAVARELHGLIHHPRALEIFGNDWVQHSSLPIPSVRAILLLFALLGDPETKLLPGDVPPEKEVNLLEFIASENHTVAMPILLGELRKLPLETLLHAARWEADLLRSRDLRFSGSRAYEWSSVLGLFQNLSDGGGPERDHGARAISRRFLEALLLRALLHRDTAALRGLAEAVEGTAPQPPVTNRIASEICGWQPRLSRELGRPLTKGAMKAFLTEMYPYFADANATTWADAWKLAGWSTDNDRKGPRNNDDAIAIAGRIKVE